MKRLKLFLTIVVASLGLQAGAVARLVWLNPVHDFGAFREEVGPVECTFLAVNTGDEPVAVVDARANCGCTRPTYNREAVEPGDTLRISVAYEPSGRPGRFRKQVKVTTNAGTKVMTVTGVVIGSSNTLKSRFPVEAGRARISNDVSPFGETVKGRVLAAAVHIYNPTADTLRPVVVSKPDYINTLMSQEAIPPGEQATLSLTAYTDRIDGWGVIEDSFRLVPDSADPENGVTVQTVMIVNEDFSKLSEKERADAPHASLSEKSIDFGTVGVGSQSAKRELTITNTGRLPLIVRALSTPEKALSVKCSSLKINPGKKATLSVTLNPAEIGAIDFKQGYFNARITLITNDPDNATQIVRAVAELK